MNDEILKATYELNMAIKKLEDEVELSKKEKMMEENEEVMVLSYRFDDAQTKYNDALKFFDKNSKEVQQAQKNLYEAKKELESHHLVRDYIEAYSKVRKYYDEIQKAIFDKFKDKSRMCK